MASDANYQDGNEIKCALGVWFFAGQLILNA